MNVSFLTTIGPMLCHIKNRLCKVGSTGKWDGGGDAVVLIGQDH